VDLQLRSTFLLIFEVELINVILRRVDHLARRHAVLLLSLVVVLCILVEFVRIIHLEVLQQEAFLLRVLMALVQVRCAHFFEGLYIPDGLGADGRVTEVQRAACVQGHVNLPVFGHFGHPLALPAIRLSINVVFDLQLDDLELVLGFPLFLALSLEVVHGQIPLVVGLLAECELGANLVLVCLVHLVVLGG